MLAIVACGLTPSAVAQPIADGSGVDAIATDDPPDLAPPSVLMEPQGPAAIATDEPLPGTQPLPPAPAPLAPPQNLSPPTTIDPPADPQRIRATPALSQPNTPSLQGGFNVRLARAPKMLGDFFGNSFAPVSARVRVGRAVHHIVGTTSGMNEIRLVDETGSVTVYGSTSYLPAISPPAPGTITGLTGTVGNHGSAEFLAVDSGDTIDVYQSTTSPSADLLGAPLYDVYQLVEVDLPAAGPADLIGRTRLNDNNSAMPEDRIYFDYNFFHNAALTADGVDVNRFAPGFEKTFWDGNASVEVRVPMGISFSSEQVAGIGPDVSQYEFGNIVIAPKILLDADCELAVAIGMGLALPTADDINLRLIDGQEAIRVKNDAVHLLPYLAMLYSPCDSRCFYHGFLTYDFDLNGNATYANLTGDGLQEIGTWSDQHLVSLNLGAGQWVYWNDCPSTRLQGVAVTAEVHYTASLNDADHVSQGAFVLGDRFADLSVINGTVGGHVRIGKTTLTTGYTAPLNSDERVFDGEFRFFANRAF